MFKFIGFLLLIVFFVILVVGILLGKVIRFFGPTQRNRSTQKSHNRQQSGTENNTIKKFSKDEGEYVNYEEIKDEE